MQYLASRFFFHKNFAKLQHHYPSLVTLPEIAQEVGEKSILFLDIKDYSISLSDIMTALQSTKVKQVYLAAQNLSYLKSLGPLPTQWKKAYNGILWLSPQKQQISSSGIQVIELLFWNYRPKNINWLEQQQISVTLARWLLPRKIYLKKCLSHSSLWMWDHRLEDLIKQRDERS